MSELLTASPQKRRASRYRYLAIISSALLLTLGLFIILLGTPQSTKAATHPGGNIQNSTILNVDVARPGVLRILTKYDGAQMTIELCQGVTETINYAHAFGALGSGTFISAHGDILTADHVVNPPKAELDIGLLQDLAPQIASDIQTKCHATVSPDEVYATYANNPDLFSTSYPTPATSAWLDISYVGSYSVASVTAAKSYPITVKAVSSVDKNDVAIVHVNLDDTPVVPIGDSDTVSPTDLLTVIGYPGNGDLGATISSESPNNFLDESINDVTVSALKTNPSSNGGLIQIGGNVENGDSGGPALNAQGQIVGVVSFGVDNTQPEGTSFLRASSTVSPLLAQASIDTTPGKFQTNWRQALTDYAASTSGHWHTAMKELQAIQQDYPLFNGVLPYLTYAQNQAQNESTSPINSIFSGQNTSFLIGAGLIALAVILVILIVVIISRSNRRAKREAAAASVPAPVLVGAMPTYQQNMGPPQNTGAYNNYGYYGGYAPPAPPTMQPPTPVNASPYPAPTATSTPPNENASAADDAQPTAPRPSLWAPAQSQAPQAQPIRSAMCVNGHPMQPYEVYCPICGAARAQG